jgi:rhamnogalacturonan endolyase
MQDELFDGTTISHWDNNSNKYTSTALGNYNASQSCNGTKATPNLQADLFGDWREEVILWSANDNATLNIFTTNIPTPYRVPTLMHDHTYRMGICWQNTAYNQPPHLGYYLPDYINGKLTGIRSLESGDSRNDMIDWTRSDLQIYDLQGRKIPTDSRLLTPEFLPSGLYIIKQGNKIIKFNKQ